MPEAASVSERLRHVQARPAAADSELGRTDEERAYYALSRRVYAVFAHVYDAVTLPVVGLRHKVAEAANLPAGARVLDVATGTGAQALAFARRRAKVIGIDLSDAMLRKARKKGLEADVSFQKADAAALPFEDASFDAASVSFALHEMPGSVRERVLQEMARVTRPGGLIIVVDYALPRGRLRSALVFHTVKLYEHESYAAFVRSDLDALLAKSGIAPQMHMRALGGLAKITMGRRSEVVPPLESQP